MEEQNFQSRDDKKQKFLKQNVCPSCNTKIDLSDSFCPECGTKINNEVTVCRICSSVCDGIFCESCGANQVSNQCGKCSTETIGDFCETCGEPVTELAIQFLEEKDEAEKLEVLSPKEAEEILKEMETLLNPEVKRMQEKMRQRIILEREREYYNQREDRIQAYQLGNRPKVKNIESEDLKKIQNQMKNFSGYIDRQIQLKQEEERELARQKKEEQIRIAEEKRLKKANRVSGLWVSTIGNSLITLDLREAQSGNGKAYINDLIMETVDILSVKWTGSKIEFHTTKIHVKWILPIWERVKIRFTGHVSEDGEMMTGYLSSAEKWQEVFIKN